MVVQVCTGVMLHSYSLVKTLCGGLQVMAGLRLHSVAVCSLRSPASSATCNTATAAALY